MQKAAAAAAKTIRALASVNSLKKLYVRSIVVIAIKICFTVPLPFS